MGLSGILSIMATRMQVVYNFTFLITASHSGVAKIVQLGATRYGTSVRIRGLGNTNGNIYIELYDTAASITSGTEQSWQCIWMPISTSTITTYTQFTDGTTLPNGYSIDSDFTTVAGAIVNNSFVGNLVGNSSTATTLQTLRMINDCPFNGSKDIRTQTAWNYELGVTEASSYYFIFAKAKTNCGRGNIHGTILLSGAGNYGGVVQGTYLITVSTRTNTPQMSVTSIVKPTSNPPIFGYYSDDTYTYFGMVSPTYQGRNTITVLETTNVTFGKLSKETTAPSGWTNFTNVVDLSKDTTYPIYGKTINADFTTKFRTQTKGSSTQGDYIGIIRNDTDGVSGSPRYGAGLAFGRADTHSYLYTSYSEPVAYIGGGNADKLNWIKQIAFTDSNVASATKATQDGNGRNIALGYVRVYGSYTNGTNSESLTATELAKQNYAIGMIKAETDNPTEQQKWCHVISMNWQNGINANWVSQIAVGTELGTGLYYRTNGQNTIVGKAWTRVLDSVNYSNYVPMTHSGTTTPANTLGKNGDIYVLLDS